MKGQKAICKVCQKEFVKKTYIQINCSQECSYISAAAKINKLWHGNRFKIFERDGFKCIYCGKTSIEDDARLILDHLIPASKGGKTTPENLVTCCTECNNGKLQMLLKEENLRRINNIIEKRIGKVIKLQLFAAPSTLYKQE